VTDDAVADVADAVAAARAFLSPAERSRWWRLALLAVFLAGGAGGSADVNVPFEGDGVQRPPDGPPEFGPGGVEGVPPELFVGAVAIAALAVLAGLLDVLVGSVMEPVPRQDRRAKLLGGPTCNALAMDRLHARYPFLEAAREAVDEAGVDLAELVAEGGAVVERAVERVENCLHEGTVGEPLRDPRTELLSYPVARVLVSLVDQPVLVRRYAAAEARTAHERFRAELADDAELESTRGRSLTRAHLLAAFDLSRQVHETPDGFRVAVGPYLRLSRDLDGEDWRLVARPLDDGEVPVSRDELLLLLREAVRERVAEGLPFAVPDDVAAGLDDEVERVEGLLADRRLPGRGDLDGVVPELFPPCVAALLERAADGEDLPHHSRFALVSFLTNLGLDPEEVAGVFDTDAETARFQATNVGEGYAPPSCATMQALGDCVDRDERCETIDHPLSYYADALADLDEPPEWDGDPAVLLERA
jgi:DNA primase large subunit